MLFRFEDLAAPPEISSHANRLTPSIWYHWHLAGCHIGSGSHRCSHLARGNRNRKEATRRCSYSNTHLPFAATGRDFHFHSQLQRRAKVAPKRARVQDKFIWVLLVFIFFFSVLAIVVAGAIELHLPLALSLSGLASWLTCFSAW